MPHVQQQQGNGQMQQNIFIGPGGGGPPVPGMQLPQGAVVSLDLLGGFGVRLADADGGVRVTDLRAGSQAANLGIQIGDIISQINGHQIAKLDEAKQILTNADETKSPKIEVTRKGKPLTLSSK